MHAVKIMQDYCSNIPFIQFVDFFTNPKFAISIIEAKKIDLILLDFSLPEISAFDFLKLLPVNVLSILTTVRLSSEIIEYHLAVEETIYEPFSFDRFYKAVENAKRKLSLPRPSS